MIAASLEGREIKMLDVWTGKEIVTSWQNSEWNDDKRLKDVVKHLAFFGMEENAQRGRPSSDSGLDSRTRDSINAYLKAEDPAGPTFLTYTPNGRKLITAGSNNVIRVYTTGSDGEPTNIDDCQENNTAVAATVGYQTEQA
ncbi:hypothetical protein MMC08_002783 [Hypocenomyce scalaris]|nr:hypothetical protein [Hypocenomyce scalaris]